jgi:hypothetical protein
MHNLFLSNFNFVNKSVNQATLKISQNLNWFKARGVQIITYKLVYKSVNL